MLRSRYGPNTVQVEAFLERLERLPEEGWLRLAAQATLLPPATFSPTEPPDPWLVALMAAEKVWNDDELGHLRSLAAEASTAPMMVLARQGPRCRDALEPIRRAASALFHRPWIDEPVCRAAYGPVDEVIGFDSLGPPPQPAIRHRAAAHPRDVQGVVLCTWTISAPANYRVTVSVMGNRITHSCERLSDAESVRPGSMVTRRAVLGVDQASLVRLAEGRWTMTAVPSLGIVLESDSRKS